MHCTIHCLVSGEDELTPIQERISEAGIASEDVFIVWRRQADDAHGLLPAEVEAAAWDVLGKMFVPAAWWWGLATGAWYGHPAGNQVKACKAARVTLIGGRGCVRQNETGPD